MPTTIRVDVRINEGDVQDWDYRTTVMEAVKNGNFEITHIDASDDDLRAAGVPGA